MSAWDQLAELPLRIDGYALEGRRVEVGGAWERRTTVVHLHGGGEEGLGEDVVYDPDVQGAAQDAGAVLSLGGEWTLRTFSAQLDALDLFASAPPDMPASRDYRRWAYESAALDLALRQNGTALHDALGRAPRPLSFVNSLRIPEPPSAMPVLRRLERYPGLRFKLDPASSWDEALIAELAATGAVDTVDLKGLYEGTVVDQPADPDLYRRVAEGFPGAWIEDPRLNAETDPVLAPHRDRITWDANLHSVADIEALPFAPRAINVKPSRFGTLERLFAVYEHCDARGIRMYGGGQSELGVGRGQIQLLAAIFHPDTPNDVAPSAFNAAELVAGLPSPPLDPDPTPTGFRWASVG